MSLVLFVAAVAAASFSSTSTVVSRDSVAGFALTSPWALAVSKSGVVYFSNFGSQDGADYIGTFAADNPVPTKYATIADIKISNIKYAHIKHLSVYDNTLFAAVYGGPSRVSYIISCENGSCKDIYKITDQGDSQHLMPTAVAYSVSLDRVFFAVADGNENASKIMSVKPDGSDVQTYLVQGASGVEYPVGLAIDEKNQLLFWSNDVGPNKIQQGPLEAVVSNTSRVGTVLQDSSRPQHIAVDAAARFVYFTDQTSTPNTISRVRYGNGKYETAETIVDGLSSPNGIAIDISKKYVFYAETGSSVIKRGTLDDLNVPAPGTSAAVGNGASAVVIVIVAISALFV